MAWVEPGTSVFLAVHGGVLLAESGEMDVLMWMLVIVTALLGVLGLAGWRSRAAVVGRAWGLLVLTWTLLYLGGGVQAFFTLWYFMLSPVYALVLTGRAAFAYPLVIGAVYPALTLVTDGTLPASVLWGRTGVITVTGLIVAGISLERARASAELVRTKDEFVASVSHELRTPLTAVVGLSAELEDNVDDISAHEISEFATTIQRQSVEVANIVEDLLVAARADIGKVKVSAEELDLLAEIEVVAREAEQAHDFTPDRIRITGESLRSTADPIRVRQVLRNLVSNAARYGGEHVEARLTREGSKAVVEIADDGLGVPGEDPALIFEPYLGLHDHASQPSSIGLGLAVSRTLARLMGGDLTYRRAEGWSVFRLELPVGD